MKGKYLASVAGVALTSMLGVGAQAQSFSWTGGYVGGYAGWAWDRSYAVTDTDCNPALYNYYCTGTDPASLANKAAVDASGTGWMYGNGFLGGIQGGYNWQFGQYVYGLQSDFGTFLLKGSRQATNDYPMFFGASYTIGTGFKTDWLFTFRGRLGWTTDDLWHEHDRLWLYATGGLALTDLKVSWNFTDDFGVNGKASATKLMPGWALGAGLEYMLNRRWSFQAEYLHLDFGNVCASGVITDGIGYSQGISTCANLNADLMRVGINYKL